MADERTANPALPTVPSYHHNHVVVFGSHWKPMLSTRLHTHTQGHEASWMLEVEEARSSIRTPNTISTDVVVHVPHAQMSCTTLSLKVKPNHSNNSPFLSV
jgi:hypothetical protein